MNIPTVTNERTRLTPVQQQLKNAVQPKVDTIPRFIFRFWHDLSGGCLGLNTTTAITPAAFSTYNRGQHPPQSFYQLNSDEIFEAANRHIRGLGFFQTPFSSWSQSIICVLTMARAAEAQGKRNLHISILDTTLLGESNVILHTVHMAELGLCNISYDDELLAYGTVSGPAYQAVTFEQFKRLLAPSPSVPLSPTATVVQWQRLVNIFDAKFRLAITAFLITVHNPANISERALLVRTLAGLVLPVECPGTMEVPPDWQHDPKIMNVETSCLQSLPLSQEALAAAMVLRGMVLQQPEKKKVSAPPTQQGYAQVLTAAEERKQLRLQKELGIDLHPKHFAPAGVHWLELPLLESLAGPRTGEQSALFDAFRARNGWLSLLGAEPSEPRHWRS